VPDSSASADGRPEGSAGEPEQIGENIAAVQSYYARQARELSRSQRGAEMLANAVGQPAFLGAIVVVVGAWIGTNELRVALGLPALDPAPYFWLQGLVSLCALLITTVVLIKQNRFARLAEQRAHLDLKVTLLIEQKTAKIIDLLEELRRDAPNIPDRHDPKAAELQQSMNPDRVLAALDEPGPEVVTPEPPAAG